MKKVFSIIMSFLMICSLTIPAMAVEANVQQEWTNVESIAYMSLDNVDVETQSQILQARNEIIFNTSWVADDVNGRIVDVNGNVIETLPHFSEVFPSDWEIPVNMQPINEKLNDEVGTYAISPTQVYADLTRTNTTFYTLNTVGFAGTVYEYYITSISTHGYYDSGSKCNIGYTNNDTGRSLGYKSNLAEGTAFEIDAPEDVSVSIYASSSSVGTWTMVVAVDRYDRY